MTLSCIGKCIKVNKKSQSPAFKALVNILLRNNNEINVQASMCDDDGNKMDNDEVAFYVAECKEVN